MEREREMSTHTEQLFLSQMDCACCEPAQVFSWPNCHSAKIVTVFVLVNRHYWAPHYQHVFLESHSQLRKGIAGSISWHFWATWIAWTCFHRCKNHTGLYISGLITDAKCKDNDVASRCLVFIKGPCTVCEKLVEYESECIVINH